MFLAPKNFLDWDYKTERSTKHLAKFRADWPTELEDYAARKQKKKTTAKQKSFRKLSFSGGLKRLYNVLESAI